MYKQTKTRILSYDIIRIVAIFMVLMIHVTSPYISNFIPPSSNFLFGSIFNGLSRAGAPLFIMLSGALMLDESRMYDSTATKKHIKTIAFLLISWSLFYTTIYNIIIPMVNHDNISLKNFLSGFLYGHYHLWFLFTIFVLYLLTPILRLFVKKENSKYIMYFIVLSIIFQFSVPFFNYFISKYIIYGNHFQTFMDQFRIDFFPVFLTYYLLGWYIAHNPIKKSYRIATYIVGIFSIVGTIAINIIQTNENLKVYNFIYSTNSINIFIYIFALFMFIFYAFKNKQIKNKFINNTIIKASTMSFGVYAIHVAILDILNQLFFNNRPCYFIPVIWLLVVIISYIVTFIASKIPFIKKMFKC